MKHVAIVGSGISACACAASLKQKGIEFTVFEKEPVAGGKLLTEKLEGFTVEAGPDGGRQLVLRQSPLMMEPDVDEKQHPIVLAKNVKAFEMQFWATDKNPPDWVDEWKEQKTNQLPKMVMVTLKVADNPRNPQAQEEITRIISLPAVTVQRVWQTTQPPSQQTGPPPPQIRR